MYRLERSSPAAPTTGGLVSVRPPLPGGSIAFQEASALFLSRTEAHKTGSRETTRAYRSDLKQFNAFLIKEATTFDRLNRSAANRYVAYLCTLDLTSRSVNRKVSTLRSFYWYMVALDLVPNNPFQGIDTPSFNPMSETHKVLSPQEFENCLRLLRKEVTEALSDLKRNRRSRAARRRVFYAVRRRAMVILLATLGLRRSELLGIMCSCIEQTPEGLRVHITGKGKKHRIVPLSPQALPALSDWLHLRKCIPTTSNKLFLTVEGRPCRKSSLEKLIEWVAKRVQTRYSLHAHMFRRSFATWQLSAHQDIRIVQELLGHASINTTQIYTAVEEGMMRRALSTAPIALSEKKIGPLLERYSSPPQSFHHATGLV